ncbi:phosphomannomutase [Formivibrio citricus]|uniref:Phosphomannomutase n=1 Tax=Formivibrio citricus TaxID=83765 RepID=A0A1I5BUZ1_9NEIS|nr:phosphomannomutase/phosphoglucomutase [Formivibrio citricus]SFN78510.1 phosphomannomutase [Formivibrio citricus]
MSGIDPSIFKAYDVRSTVDRLTPEAARLIGRAMGSLARERGFSRIAVGRDGRLSSPALAAELSAGLTDCGMTVLEIGLAATPLLYFAALRQADGCGAMVTGSHNPPDYNGIKLMLGGDAVDGISLQSLRARIEADDFVTGTGEIVPLEVAAQYLEAVRVALPVLRPLKVVIDCGNGAPGAVAPELYRRLGCEVVALYCEVDGRFPHHHPDPQVAANLADLQYAVIEHGADVGLAFDGDGDRLGVVTRQGRIVPGDQLLVLFAQAELARRPGLVLYDVKSSRLVARMAAQYGGCSAAIPTGHSHMKRALKAQNALLAGELSGHFAFAGWDVDDALYAGAKLLQILAGGADLDAELARYPQVLASPELQVKLSEDGRAVVGYIAENADFPSAAHVFTVDGLRVEYPDGFGLIRASNTTPVLTLRIEADDRQALARIRNELAAAIVPLPFPDWNEE